MSSFQYKVIRDKTDKADKTDKTNKTKEKKRRQRNPWVFQIPVIKEF
jgi:hypothetical protein